MEQQIEKYQQLKPLYESFNERLKALIKSLIEENGIKYQFIESRTKSIESFSEKLIRKEDKYSNPIDEITDLAGIRIIVYYQDDVDKIEEIIKREFLIDEKNSTDKGKLLKANEFGYQSVHYVLSLSDNRNKLSEWKKYSKLKAEIQIRTVLQHSWASISHELEYKKNYEIPSILKRRLFRLAGLIELADEEFKQSRDQHNELLIKISNGRLPDSKENNEIFDELNLLTLENYFKDSNVVLKIKAEALRAGFKDRHLQNDNKYLSQMISICQQLNIRSISELNILLESSIKKSFVLFDKLIKNQENEWSGSLYFFVLLILINENINNFKDTNDLLKDGWGENIASLVLKTFRDK